MNRILILIACLVFLVSCRVVNPSQMLRTKSGYKYAQIKDTLSHEYKIAPDDVISFVVLPNKGEKLITASGDAVVNTYNKLTFVVNENGMVKLPLLGETKFGGLTKKEAEKMLEEKFAAYINNPYVKLDIDNRKVIVFRGGDKSSVIKLPDENTTLFEIIAMAGGTDDAKAHRIKLIRMENNVPQVYLIDLSKAENIYQGNIVLQSNDIIYITPRDRIPEKILASVTPYLSLLATVLAVIALFK